MLAQVSIHTVLDRKIWTLAFASVTKSLSAFRLG